MIARVVEPISLLDAGRVLEDLGRAPASYSTLRRTLARTATDDYRDRIASWCFGHASASGDISLVLYDVTTLYFEAEKEDELQKVGYSKERRVDPQIVVGLLVDRRGFPPGDRLLRGQQGRDHHDHPRHQGLPGPPRGGRHGRRRRRRHALGDQPARAR